MRSAIKTLILAAAGAAVLAASPALAKSKHNTVEQQRVPAVTQLNQDDAAIQAQSGFNSYDTFGQIRAEYLKDAPSHNGNSY